MKGSDKQNKLIKKFIREIQGENLTIHEAEKIPSLLNKKIRKKIKKQKREELFCFLPESSNGYDKTNEKYVGNKAN